MSVIGGVVYDDVAADADDRLREQASFETAMARSAPHGTTAWRGAAAFLAHAHLRTVAAPVHNLDEDDGRFKLTGDVRLDNADDLARSLSLPADTGDAAILLAAFERWGDRCCERLIGDFAFAIWDRQERSLFCARDHLGVRPFYVRREPDRFMFASDAGVLAGDARRIDSSHIAAFLAGLSEEETRTSDPRIDRLPPAHRLVFKDGRTVVSRYWTLEPESPPAPGEVVEAFRERFEAAVRCRLSGPARVGAMLSGGLDSSSICAVAARIAEGSEAFTAFSLVYPETPGTDESRFIRAVAQRSGLRSVRVPADEIPPLYGFSEMTADGQGLVNAPGSAKTRRLYEAIAADGTGVVLDGHGGDEVVWHGALRILDLAKEGDWARFVAQLPGLARLFGDDPVRMFFAVFNAHGPRHRAGRGIRRIGRGYGRWRDGPGGPKMPEGLQLLSPRFLEASRLEERVAASRASAASARGSDAQAHAHAILSPRTPAAFEALARIGSGLGIEARYPFFDKRLVSFALGLPASEKLRAGWSRSVLRRAMAGYLPEEVRWRRDKIDFGPSLTRGLVARHLSLLDDMAADRDGRIAPYLDMDALRALIANLIADPARVATVEAAALWRAACLFLLLGERRLEVVH